MDRSWDYPYLENALRAAGLEAVYTYISIFHDTVARYILMQPILGICLEVKRRPGLQVTKWWWEQAGLNLAERCEAMG